MTSSSQRVAKNTSILMLSQLVTTALSMFLVIIQPRIIGDVGIGTIAYAESIWGMAVVFVLFGMDVLIMKEVARKPEDSQKLLSTAVFLLIPLYLLSAILVAVWTISHNFSDEEILVIVIFGVASFIWQFSFLYRATLIGLEHIGAISKADIIGKVFNTFVGLAVLYVTRNVVAMAWVGVGMASLTHLIQWRYLRRYFTLTLQIDYGYAWQLLRSGVPYMLSALFLAGYTRADTLIMRELLNREAIGWYSTSDRLFGTLLFVPTAFIGAMFPLMSRTYANDRDALPKMIQRSFGLMLILGVPIGMGLFAMAQPIINMLYGAEFFNTGAILSMMGFVLTLMYLTVLIGKFLISADRQSVWTKLMAVATVVTFGLDLILIPFFERQLGNGAVGGPVAYIITETGMLSVGLWLLPKGSLNRSMLWRSLRTVAAGALMVAAVWPVRNWYMAFVEQAVIPGQNLTLLWQALIILPVLVGAVTYLFFVYLFKLIPEEDWRLAVELMPARIKRFLPKPKVAINPKWL